MSKEAGILLFSEDRELEFEISDFLNRGIQRADTLKSAMAVLEKGRIEVMLIGVGEEDILETIVHIHSLYPYLPVVVIADECDEEYAIETLKAGAQEYLLRERLNPQMLPRVIRYAIERQSLMARLRSLSLADELTGLFNLRGFLTLARQQLKSAERGKRGFQLWFFDIDNMKDINDIYGHSAGDAALIQTAKLLENSFRKSDIIGRIGGDEFTVLALECEGEDSMRSIERRIQKNLLEENKAKYMGYELSISYGVAQYYPSYAASVEELMARADRLMYGQKRGKTRKAS